jgi:hypothetical protein
MSWILSEMPASWHAIKKPGIRWPKATAGQVTAVSVLRAEGVLSVWALDPQHLPVSQNFLFKICQQGPSVDNGVGSVPDRQDLIIGLGWIGLVYNGFPGSCLEGTQERTDGVLAYFEDDRLGAPLCVFVLDRHIVAFAF